MVKEKNILEEKISVCLDQVGFNKKPKKNEVMQISERIASNSVNLSIEELMNSVTVPNARSFTPALFSDGQRLNQSWKSQQVFALDIDSGLRIGEAIKLSAEWKVTPTFIYSTFSHTEEHQKFRIVFILDEEIQDLRVRNVIQTALTTLFPSSDKNANDAARILFGGMKIEFVHRGIVSVPQILDAVVHKIKSGSNATREMKKFCKASGLALHRGYPHYKKAEEKDLPISDNNSLYISKTENRTNTINYYSTRAKNSHYSYYLVFSRDSFQDDKSFTHEHKFFREHEVKLIRNFPFENLKKRCKLYRKGISGDYWLYHHEMFGLMTNLLNIEGGKSKVIDIINSRKDYLNKKEEWSLMMNQIKKMNYTPTRCDTYCPFADECIHSNNMIEQGKLPRGSVQVLQEPQFREVDEVYKKLEEVLEDIMYNKDQGVYVIKAPTGLGKTEAIVNLAQENSFSIAFPTHKLKEEVSQRLNAKSIEHLKVPELPLLEEPFSDKIDHLYNIGAYKTVNKFLRKISNENEEISRFLNDLEKVKSAKEELLLTTHQRSIFTNDNSNSTVIFDEDPIPNLFPISHMKVSDLVFAFTKLQDNEGNKEVIRTLQHMIMNAPYDIVQERSSFLLPSVRELEQTIVEESTISSNVLGFLNCDYFLKKKNNNTDYIYFIQRNQLPSSKKTIILSATINEQISKLVFGEEVKFVDLGFVEPKGSMLQVTSKSFSRYTIKENQQVLQRLAENLMKRYNPNSEVITYKDFFNYEKKEEIYFGNTEGIDDLKGENITVIGTPHLNPIAYLLISVALGYRMGLEESRMEYIPVERNGLRFYFTTYSSDTLLKEVQFYLVESQLLQAIGRARVNRYPAKVLILSNLPVVGAEYISFSQKELIELMK
ncbi:hypothetical protein NC661_03130 [Aquibacillus koreensis]|uniref:Helicase ATP-binding domain-containing protein n=1 Tax=Aquibacillus koreensis TaxID=279446 RepID=A0A9X3WI31_9BACI|nr:hypothetical protein [Aquibacillus koreensis]MCT2536559.1 hypothetical protein [Aquibacillus koreensis]MDC3419353.1 hypothetical protein [Aquibacillus koreensis]